MEKATRRCNPIGAVKQEFAGRRRQRAPAGSV